jgi:non-homologous end joining protein Ku
VDADTGEEVANEDIVKGYKVDTDTFVEVTKEELENVALPVAIKKARSLGASCDKSRLVLRAPSAP